MTPDQLLLLLAVVAVVVVFVLILAWPKKGQPGGQGRGRGPNRGRRIMEDWNDIELDAAGYELTRRIGEGGLGDHLAKFGRIANPPPVPPPNP